MRRRDAWVTGLAVALAACDGSHQAGRRDAAHRTTASAIAIANLDHAIARHGDGAGVADLLLMRSRFLGDHAALERAVATAGDRAETGADLVRRARTRASVHRFAEALADVAAAERRGADREETSALRASILVAIGRARDVVRQLEARVDSHPGFASRSALAGAYAMVGRLADADRLYVAALDDLDTTSPFPYAWVYFARGVMWAEQGGDSARAADMYVQALRHLPEFVAANVHLAELEAARGDLASALALLEPVATSSGEPEALALLGDLHVRTGDPTRGRREIARARERYERLLARHPLAFADHAAQFYLGPGANAERAWVLAQANLANRATDGALALGVRAALATGRRVEACALATRHHAGAMATPAVRYQSCRHRAPTARR